MNPRHKLIEENLKYARGCASKFSGAYKGTAQWQDAYSVARLELVKVAQTFDPSRGVLLGTFAWKHMKGAILNLRTKDAQHPLVEEDEVVVAYGHTPEHALLDAERAVVISDRMARLGKTERAYVEAVLEGRSTGPTPPPGTPAAALRSVEKIAGAAGLKVKAPEKETLTGAQRSARWYSRMTPEQRDAQNEKRRARRAAKRVGVAA